MATLDRWFSSKPIEVPEYFYQDWSMNSITPKAINPAVWLNHTPKLMNFQRKVIWPEMRKEIIICGYIPLKASQAVETKAPEETKELHGASETKEPHSSKAPKEPLGVEAPNEPLGVEATPADWADQVRIPAESKYQNEGMLKSHLQKCIRRQVTEPAVQSAYHLFKMDPEALFRRLTIIVLEDVYLLEAYGTLTWLSLARQDPRFRWTLPMIEWTLSLVRQLSEFTYFDNCQPPTRSRFNFPNNLSKMQKKLTPREQALLYAMKVRRDLIDSMPGEQVMQDQKIHLWFLRFSDSDVGAKSKFTDLVYQPLIWTAQIPAPLKLKDWILPGIDYHCSPMIVDWTIQKFPDLTPKEIKNAIWHKRSSVNNRRYLEPMPEVSPETDAVWKKIRTNVENSSFYILKHFH